MFLCIAACKRPATLTQSLRTSVRRLQHTRPCAPTLDHVTDFRVSPSTACGNYDFRYDMQKGLRPRRSVRIAMSHGEQLVAFDTAQSQRCNSWLIPPILVCVRSQRSCSTPSSRRRDLAWTSASRRPSRAWRATMSRYSWLARMLRRGRLAGPSCSRLRVCSCVPSQPNMLVVPPQVCQSVCSAALFHVPSVCCRGKHSQCCGPLFLAAAPLHGPRAGGEDQVLRGRSPGDRQL